MDRGAHEAPVSVSLTTFLKAENLGIGFSASRLSIYQTRSTFAPVLTTRLNAELARVVIRKALGAPDVGIACGIKSVTPLYRRRHC
jgi:hypothetical protein